MGRSLTTTEPAGWGASLPPALRWRALRLAAVRAGGVPGSCQQSAGHGLQQLSPVGSAGHASAASNRSPDASGWASARWRGRGGSGSPRSDRGLSTSSDDGHPREPGLVFSGARIPQARAPAARLRTGRCCYSIGGQAIYDAAVNSEILVWARKTAGLTIEDAVAKLHIKDERLAALERGEQDPTRNPGQNGAALPPAASHLLPVRASTARGSWRGFPHTPCGSIIRDGTAHRRTRPRRAEPPEHGATLEAEDEAASAVHRNA